jgi:hypothetical protein
MAVTSNSKETKMSELELLIQTITNQIAKPARAVVNSESAFVQEALYKHNSDLARRYWSWVCNEAWDPTRGAVKFGQAVYDLQVKLDQVSKRSQSQMPDWGISGT